MPMNIILIAIGLCVIPLFFLYHTSRSRRHRARDGRRDDHRRLLVFRGRGYMAGLVGSSNNPVSGITISTILVSSLLLLVHGRSQGRPGRRDLDRRSRVLRGAIGGDNLQDLKCGQLVGSTPWKQQVMLGVGASRPRRSWRRCSICCYRPTGSARGCEGATARRAAGDADGHGRERHLGGGLPWTIIGDRRRRRRDRSSRSTSS